MKRIIDHVNICVFVFVESKYLRDLVPSCMILVRYEGDTPEQEPRTRWRTLLS